MKLIPPWAQAAIVAAVLLVVFGAGWTVRGWKSGKKIARLEGQVTVLQTEQATTEESNRLLIENTADVQKMLDASRETQARAQLLYRAAIEAPPETVTRWKTRWREAPAAIVSAPCEVQLADTHAFLLEAFAEVDP
jgi:hypothetical protein